MDLPLLADPIHAAASLVQPRRRPRQLEMNHQPAAMVEVEPLGGGIGRDQQRSRPG